jgi:hypothetical protein
MYNGSLFLGRHPSLHYFHALFTQNGGSAVVPLRILIKFLLGVHIKVEERFQFFSVTVTPTLYEARMKTFISSNSACRTRIGAGP